MRAYIDKNGNRREIADQPHEMFLLLDVHLNGNYCPACGGDEDIIPLAAVPLDRSERLYWCPCGCIWCNEQGTVTAWMPFATSDVSDRYGRWEEA